MNHKEKKNLCLKYPQPPYPLLQGMLYTVSHYMSKEWMKMSA